MATTAIIAEYNPFHNGHLYQLNKAKEITNSDYVISVMSGSFLQRGIPAVTNKYHRAHMAVCAGLDVILELPFVYATSSARDFAISSVVMLNKLHNIDYLAFGAECDDLPLLQHIADIIINEPEEISALIKEFTSQGMSYPVARAKALAGLEPAFANVVATPNNILAIEYISALKKTNSSIKPVVIKRHAAQYNSTDIDGSICSSTAIRSLFSDIYDKQLNTSQNDIKSYNISQNHIFDEIKNVIPSSIYDIFAQEYNTSYPINIDDFSCWLQYLMTINKGAYDYTIDMTKELYNKLMKCDCRQNISSICQQLKSKDVTLTRVNRAILHYIFQLTENDMNEFKENGWIYYGRILGLRKNASAIIKEFKNTSDIPIITKAADAYDVLTPTGRKMFDYDITSTKLYNAAVYNKFGTRLPNDFTVKLPVI
jgi:predicted nucleotidyltransferase